MVGMERTTEKDGPCRYLLAHSRKLLTNNTDSTSPSRLLGMGIVHIRMAMRDYWNSHKLSQVESPQQPRDTDFPRHGVQRAYSYKATLRLHRHSRLLMDNSRRSQLHRRSTFLYPSQAQIQPHSVPFLCTPRNTVSHFRGVEYPHRCTQIKLIGNSLGVYQASHGKQLSSLRYCLRQP